MAASFHWIILKQFSQSNSEMPSGMPRAARLPTYLANLVNSVNLALLNLLSSTSWFALVCISMVSGQESGLELEESHLMLKKACLCFRISSLSSPFVDNNPSLQIHSFSEDQGKCNRTGNPSISDFSTVLTSHILTLADSSYLPSDEAYRQRISLPCDRLSTPCYPMRSIFSPKFSLKRDSVYSVTYVGRLEIMVHHTPSIICDFHFAVDSRLHILFPHIFWNLHQN